MSAVIETGGKQYRVREGDVLKIQRLEHEEGKDFEFDKVMMVSNGDKIVIGKPYVDAKVSAKVLSHGRAKKIEILKFKRRKHQMKRQGHRQDYTEIQIEGISS